MIGHLEQVYSMGFYSEKVELKDAIQEVLKEIDNRINVINKDKDAIMFEAYAGFYWKFAEEGLNNLLTQLRLKGYNRVHIETYPYEYNEYKQLRFGRFYIEF